MSEPFTSQPCIGSVGLEGWEGTTACGVRGSDVVANSPCQFKASKSHPVCSNWGGG